MGVRGQGLGKKKSSCAVIFVLNQRLLTVNLNQ